MSGRDSTARRCADAAFELCLAGDTVDDWEHDLGTLVEALHDPELREVVDHPAIAIADKRKVLRRVAPDVGEQPLSLVLHMLQRGRGGAIDPMALRFADLVRRERGITRAEVRSALPLEDAERTAISKRVHELTGDKVELHETVDAALIGGITVRIGDQLWDASVRSRLERLRTRLTAV